MDNYMVQSLHSAASGRNRFDTAMGCSTARSLVKEHEVRIGKGAGQ